jgi:hypothetical protein
MTPPQVILRRAPSGGFQASPSDRKFLGGQFIPAEQWEHEKAEAKLQSSGLVADFSEEMQFLTGVYRMALWGADHPMDIKPQDAVSPDMSERRIKASIRRAYDQAFVLGRRAAGNLTSPNEADDESVARLRVDEYKYLRGFLKDMRDGTGSMPYENRADYYGKAAREAYWLGYARADTSRRIKWVLGVAEHCADCERMADKGLMSVPDLLATGLLPQSGKLACLGYHCKCSLE